MRGGAGRHPLPCAGGSAGPQTPWRLDRLACRFPRPARQPPPHRAWRRHDLATAGCRWRGAIIDPRPNDPSLESASARMISRIIPAAGRYPHAVGHPMRSPEDAQRRSQAGQWRATRDGRAREEGGAAGVRRTQGAARGLPLLPPCLLAVRDPLRLLVDPDSCRGATAALVSVDPLAFCDRRLCADRLEGAPARRRRARRGSAPRIPARLPGWCG